MTTATLEKPHLFDETEKLPVGPPPEKPEPARASHGSRAKVQASLHLGSGTGRQDPH